MALNKTHRAALPSGCHCCGDARGASADYEDVGLIPDFQLAFVHQRWFIIVHDITSGIFQMAALHTAGGQAVHTTVIKCRILTLTIPLVKRKPRGVFRGVAHQQLLKPLFCKRIRPRAPLARLIGKRSRSSLSTDLCG
jgi:hypothetical protein